MRFRRSWIDFCLFNVMNEGRGKGNWRIKLIDASGISRINLRRMRRNDGTGRDAHTGNNDRPGDTASGNQRRDFTCYHCGRVGHTYRNCRQNRQGPDRQDENATMEDPASTSVDNVYVNHTTHLRESNRATNKAIYIRGRIEGKPKLLFIDTGS